MPTLGVVVPAILRLLAKVEYAPSGCWQWTAKRGATGYAYLWRDGKNRLAHRLAFEFFKHPIPSGRQIDHLCGNRSCVNPEHLACSTPRENTLRGNTPASANLAKTHCKNGHPLKPAGDRRVCPTCAAAANQRYKARKATT